MSSIKGNEKKSKEISWKTRKGIKRKVSSQKGKIKMKCECPTLKGTCYKGSEFKRRTGDDKGGNIEKMKLKIVLNGKVFASNILTKSCMIELVDVVTIQEWSHIFETSAPYLH